MNFFEIKKVDIGGGDMYYQTSIWAGKYSSVRGWVLEKNYIDAIILKIVYSIMEIPRVIKLNIYHWGNPFCFGKKLTDKYGSK